MADNIDQIAARFCGNVCDEIHGEGVWTWCDDLYRAQRNIADYLRQHGLMPRATCPSHGPMRLVLAQHRCDTCGAVDELAAFDPERIA